mmetsp:Transcript_56660/g.160736  ORF Transcript_56660/g.160736 Transcript_56660/m.160736 type:complete len:201 (+) Transcript_56660:277-879(+)
MAGAISVRTRHAKNTVHPCARSVTARSTRTHHGFPRPISVSMIQSKMPTPTLSVKLGPSPACVRLSHAWASLTKKPCCSSCWATSSGGATRTSRASWDHGTPSILRTGPWTASGISTCMQSLLPKARFASVPQPRSVAISPVSLEPPGSGSSTWNSWAENGCFCPPTWLSCGMPSTRRSCSSTTAIAEHLSRTRVPRGRS